MRELTQEQMTETIGRACGMTVEIIKATPYRVEMLSGEEESFHPFKPWDDWEDFHLACDRMGIESSQANRLPDGQWQVMLRSNGAQTRGVDPDQQTAAFLALYEFAKWKLEQGGTK